MNKYVTVAVVSIVGIVVLLAVIITSNVRFSSIDHRPRLRVFSGAYAIYSGKVFAIFTTQSLVFSIHVLDYNETHAYVSIYSNMFGQEGKITAWIPLDDPWSKLLNATSHHEETEYISELGVRDCYVYLNETSGSLAMVYIDKQTLWPLKFKLKHEAGFIVEVELVDSNVFKK